MRASQASERTIAQRDTFYQFKGCYLWLKHSTHIISIKIQRKHGLSNQKGIENDSQIDKKWFRLSSEISNHVVGVDMNTSERIFIRYVIKHQEHLSKTWKQGAFLWFKGSTRIKEKRNQILKPFHEILASEIAMVLQTFIYFSNVFCIIGNDFSTRGSRLVSHHTGYIAICSSEAFALTRGLSWWKVGVNCSWLHIHLLWISNLIQFKAFLLHRWKLSCQRDTANECDTLAGRLSGMTKRGKAYLSNEIFLWG